MRVIDKLALIFVIVGALNWGGVGLFQFNTVTYLCGGPETLAARIVYSLVALAGLWCISILFQREWDEVPEHSYG